MEGFSGASFLRPYLQRRGQAGILLPQQRLAAAFVSPSAAFCICQPILRAPPQLLPSAATFEKRFPPMKVQARPRSEIVMETQLSLPAVRRRSDCPGPSPVVKPAVTL